ncbi:MAG: carbonic anhydrase, partial [Bacteroidota bacterium]
HNQCGMVNLMARKDLFIEGLIARGGWDRKQAEEHFMSLAPMFEIGNEIDFVLAEANRLQLKYPKVLVVTMLYKVEDNRLYLLKRKD